MGRERTTGVVNVITKSPREAPGTTVSFTGGVFDRDAGSTTGKGMGTIFGANASFAQAPSAKLSYRVSAGYFNSDPLPRPVGQIPLIQDPRDPDGHDRRRPVSGSTPTARPARRSRTRAPASRSSTRASIRRSTAAAITYQGGVAGSSGIIHTGIGPFDIQKGSYIGYGKVNYRRKALKVNVFANFTDAEAPNLLLADPTTQKPLQLNFSTQTYDVEVGDSLAAGTQADR